MSRVLYVAAPGELPLFCELQRCGLLQAEHLWGLRKCHVTVLHVGPHGAPGFNGDLTVGREWTWCVPQQPAGASGTSYVDGLLGVCEGVDCALQPHNGREGVVVLLTSGPRAGELCRLAHAALLIWQEPALDARSALAAPMEHLLETHATTTKLLLGAGTGKPLQAHLSSLQDLALLRRQGPLRLNRHLAELECITIGGLDAGCKAVAAVYQRGERRWLSEVAVAGEHGRVSFTLPLLGLSDDVCVAFWADAAHIFPDVDLPRGMYSFHTAFEPRGSFVVDGSRLDMPAGQTGCTAELGIKLWDSHKSQQTELDKMLGVRQPIYQHGIRSSREQNLSQAKHTLRVLEPLLNAGESCSASSLPKFLGVTAARRGGAMGSMPGRRTRIGSLLLGATAQGASGMAPAEPPAAGRARSQLMTGAPSRRGHAQQADTMQRVGQPRPAAAAGAGRSVRNSRNLAAPAHNELPGARVPDGSAAVLQQLPSALGNTGGVASAVLVSRAAAHSTQLLQTGCRPPQQQQQRQQQADGTPPRLSSEKTKDAVPPSPSHLKSTPRPAASPPPPSLPPKAGTSAAAASPAAPPPPLIAASDGSENVAPSGMRMRPVYLKGDNRIRGAGSGTIFDEDRRAQPGKLRALYVLFQKEEGADQKPLSQRAEPAKTTFMGRNHAHKFLIGIRQLKDMISVASSLQDGSAHWQDLEILRQALPPQEVLDKLLKCAREPGFDPSACSEADRILLELLALEPSPGEKVKLLLGMLSADEALPVLIQAFQQQAEACQAVLRSKRLPAYYQSIIDCTNFLNQDHPAASFTGFRPPALEELAHCRAVPPAGSAATLPAEWKVVKTLQQLAVCGVYYRDEEALGPSALQQLAESRDWSLLHELESLKGALRSVDPEELAELDAATQHALEGYSKLVPDSVAASCCSEGAPASGGLPLIPDLAADEAAAAASGKAQKLWQYLCFEREKHAQLKAAQQAACAAGQAVRRWLCADPNQELVELFRMLLRFAAAVDADYQAFMACRKP